jgi:hypothetical protein
MLRIASQAATICDRQAIEAATICDRQAIEGGTDMSWHLHLH